MADDLLESKIPDGVLHADMLNGQVVEIIKSHPTYRSLEKSFNTMRQAYDYAISITNPKMAKIFKLIDIDHREYIKYGDTSIRKLLLMEAEKLIDSVYPYGVFYSEGICVETRVPIPADLVKTVDDTGYPLKRIIIRF